MLTLLSTYVAVCMLAASVMHAATPPYGRTPWPYVFAATLIAAPLFTFCALIGAVDALFRRSR